MTSSATALRSLAWRGVAALVRAVPALAGLGIEAEQVAQFDSKRMSHAVWRCAARTIWRVLTCAVSSCTDRLEETACFLQRVLAPVKPVVLTAAMRPATAWQSDGPQNLLDAVRVARLPNACGVVAVLAGQVMGARDVRKVHLYRIDAFGPGDAGVIGHVEEGQLRQFRPWPQGEALGLGMLPADGASGWPQVEIVTSDVGASGAVVRALRSIGVRGLVVAATGNGTVHPDLEAQAHGMAVLRSARCRDGCVLAAAHDVPASAGDLTPGKARVELMLSLMRPV